MNIVGSKGESFLFIVVKFGYSDICWLFFDVGVDLDFILLVN